MKAVAALAVLSLVLLPACRRADRSTAARVKADLAGAWVRELRDGGPRVEGFDLREDGSVALLGIFSLNGIAWNVSGGELVISTNTVSSAQPNPSRLRIASLEGDVLTLRADPPDYLAGTFHRTGVDRVTGVVTYLERVALPPDARVEVRLMRGVRLIARTLITAGVDLPIPFALSYLPEPVSEGRNLLEASILSADGPLFASAAPVPIEAGATGVELLVRRAHASR